MLRWQCCWRQWALCLHLCCPDSAQTLRPLAAVLSCIFYTENSETGLTTREAGEDGLFHVRFAYEGEQVELTVANDRQLVNYMDTLDAMGLVRDADGLVVDVVDPTVIATEVAKDFFVKEVRDDTIVANTSKAMNGMDITLALTDSTGIYDVSSNGETAGQVSR